MDDLELFTATPVARRIAHAAGVEPEPVLRALRKMMANGMVQPSVTPQGSSTAPNLFDEAGVYRAAVAFSLSRIGLSDDAVREAAGFFDRYEGEPIPSNGAAWKALKAMPESPAFFHLFHAPDYFQKPANIAFGSFSASRDASMCFQGGTDAWFITTSIPLRGLVADLTQTDDELAQMPPKGN